MRSSPLSWRRLRSPRRSARSPTARPTAASTRTSASCCSTSRTPRLAVQRPGRWFTCSGTLLSPTVARYRRPLHVRRRQGQRLDDSRRRRHGRGPRRRRRQRRLGRASPRSPNFDILPASSTFTTQAARYAGWTARAQRRAASGTAASRRPTRSTTTSRFFVHDAGVVRPVEPGHLPTVRQDRAAELAQPLPIAAAQRPAVRDGRLRPRAGPGQEGVRRRHADAVAPQARQPDEPSGGTRTSSSRTTPRPAARASATRAVRRSTTRARTSSSPSRRGARAPTAAARAAPTASTSPTTSRSWRGSASTRNREALATSTAPGTAGGRFVSSTSVHGGAAYDGGTPLPEDPPMPDRRALLHQTADLAADFLDGLAERPVGATADPRRAARGVRRAAADGRRGARRGRRPPRRGRRPGPGRERRAALLRVRDRRLAAGRARRRLADERLGPERRRCTRSSPAASVAEEVAAGWLLDLFGLPAGLAVGFVDRRDDGHFTAPRGRPPPRSSSGSAGTSRTTG